MAIVTLCVLCGHSNSGVPLRKHHQKSCGVLSSWEGRDTIVLPLYHSLFCGGNPIVEGYRRLYAKNKQHQERIRLVIVVHNASCLRLIPCYTARKTFFRPFFLSSTAWGRSDRQSETRKMELCHEATGIKKILKRATRLLPCPMSIYIAPCHCIVFTIHIGIYITESELWVSSARR